MHRPIVSRLLSGSTTYALTQTSYDALGRLRCVAQRMNPAEFGLAALGRLHARHARLARPRPDRAHLLRPAGRSILVETGVGVTGVAADEVATTYTRQRPGRDASPTPKAIAPPTNMTATTGC